MTAILVELLERIDATSDPTALSVYGELEYAYEKARQLNAESATSTDALEAFAQGCVRFEIVQIASELLDASTAALCDASVGLMRLIASILSYTTPELSTGEAEQALVDSALAFTARLLAAHDLPRLTGALRELGRAAAARPALNIPQLIFRTHTLLALFGDDDEDETGAFPIATLNFVYVVLASAAVNTNSAKATARQFAANEALLDEIVLRIALDDRNTAASACACLYEACEHFPPLRTQLLDHYTGLAGEAARWSALGVDEARNLHAHLAAVTLQSAWRRRIAQRSASTRLTNIVRVQRLVKQRFHQRIQQRRRDRHTRDHNTAQAQAQFQRFLHSCEQEMALLRALPPSRMHQYTAMRRVRAAVRIQSVWRAHRVRTTVSLCADKVRRKREADAATLIQRFWRHYKRMRQCEQLHESERPGLWSRHTVESVLSSVSSGARAVTATEEKAVDLLALFAHYEQSVLGRSSGVKRIEGLARMVRAQVSELQRVRDDHEEVVQHLHCTAAERACAARHHEREMALVTGSGVWWEDLKGLARDF